MLVLHHLGVSQSERIVWLLEELGVEYKLVRHTRDPILSPDSLKNVPGNEMGRSPFFEDTDEGVAMAESSAIGEYLVTKYNPGKLNLTPDDKHYADYLYWFVQFQSGLESTRKVNADQHGPGFISPTPQHKPGWFRECS